MARIGIQLMMLKDHVAEQGIGPVLERVRETGFEVVEVSQIPMTEENVAGMEAARERLGIEVAAISAATARARDGMSDATTVVHRPSTAGGTAEGSGMRNTGSMAAPR